MPLDKTCSEILERTDVYQLKRFSARFLLQLVVLSLPVSMQAAVLNSDFHVETGSGDPIRQQFLQTGASVVTTRDARSCVVSELLDVKNAIYRTPDGSRIDFDDIIRSPATSLQAISSASGDLSFRIQLKYSISQDTPIMLLLGDERQDLQMYLEKSTDSLWLVGDAAKQLEAAFRDGVVPILSSVSSDTGHTVIDRIGTPDLEALATCVTDLASADLSEPPVSNVISMTFAADRDALPLATEVQLRACRMKDEPGELYLARLETVEGFFAHTDKVFVSFDDQGSLERAYIPGIFDGDFRQGRKTGRLSRAADSNVPSAPNDVKGCLGSAEVPVCNYTTNEGRFSIGPCLEDTSLLSFMDATGFIPEQFFAPAPRSIGNSASRNPGGNGFQPGGGPGVRRPDVTTSGGPGGFPRPLPSLDASFQPRPVKPVVDRETPPIISSVPLPASMVLLMTAFAALLGVRRKVTGNRVS